VNGLASIGEIRGEQRADGSVDGRTVYCRPCHHMEYKRGMFMRAGIVFVVMIDSPIPPAANEPYYFGPVER